MQVFTAVIEKCPNTGLYAGYVPNFAGAHSQGATLDELSGNLQEVIAMVLTTDAVAPQPFSVRLQKTQIAKDVGLTVDEFLAHR